jgi:membrane protein
MSRKEMLRQRFWSDQLRGWWGVIREFWVTSNKDDVFGRAAQLGFYFLLALFPALLGVTALIGMLPEQVLLPTLIYYAEKILPDESLILVEQYAAQAILGSEDRVLYLSLLGALWAASWGMMAIINSLNVVYDVKETRPIWKTGGVAVLLTIGAVFFVITSLILLLAGEQVSRWVGDVMGMEELGATVYWSLLQWPIIVLIMLTGLNLIYYWAPNTDHEWQWIKPGSILAVFLWVGLSLGLKNFVENFVDYNPVYGSITGVIILMMWLYVSGLALLLGGELNCILKKRQRQNASVSSGS